MLVTPQLRQEMDVMLKDAQGELAQLSKELDGHIARAPGAREMLEVKIHLGDLDLMIKRALNGRRF